MLIFTDKFNIVRIFIATFLFISGISSFALAQQLVIKGAVLDYDSGQRIGNAEIVNGNLNVYSASNTMGLFTIRAKEGDTLKINKADYNESMIVVRGTSDLIIRIKPSLQLEEVNVFGQSKKDQLDNVMDDFRKKGNYYNGKPPILAYALSPISALYGLLGKTPKNARRFQNYMNKELEESVVDRKFPSYLVETVTSLSGEDLSNFLALYRPSYSLSQNWNDYDTRAYIKKSFEKFEYDGRPKRLTLPKIPIPKQEK